jgi:outer membrane protein TolC
VPDPELRVEARQFNGAGFIEYDTGIFFNLPWVNPGKYKSAIAEAKLNRESAEQDLAAMQAETSGLVRDQVKKITTFHHHYTLFHDRLLPLARQTLNATRIGYENNKASLLELLTALRTLRDTESTLQSHLTDYLAALAELEALAGASLENLIPTKP